MSSTRMVKLDGACLILAVLSFAGVFELWRLRRKLGEARREIQRQKRIARSHSKLASLGEMSGEIAHEINNPLTVILALAEQIKIICEANDFPVNKKIIDKTERIRVAIDRISKIVQGLRRFSRDSGAEAKSVAYLGGVIEETVELCRQRFAENQVELQFEKHAVPLFISCRPVQISQVILNCLNNAFDAALKSDRKLVRIRMVAEGDRAHILIEDSGSGIGPEHVHRVFEPFYTTKEAGQGTGLGLSISKTIVEEHHGRMSAENSDLGGACFRISLPLQLEQHPAEI